MAKSEKPNKYPRWASSSIKNEINGEYNIYEPPEQKKDIGWDLNEVPPRQWFNWLFRTINDWIMHFDHHLNRPKIYSKATLPDAASCKAQIVFVSNIDGGTLAFSDGKNWKKINITGNI
jgi:hypothetical protein